MGAGHHVGVILRGLVAVSDLAWVRASEDAYLVGIPLHGSLGSLTYCLDAEEGLPRSGSGSSWFASSPSFKYWLLLFGCVPCGYRVGHVVGL